jgi:glycosyltransferase involved in cell wall biosynthesis
MKNNIQHPKISVVTVVFNNVDRIEETILSVACQQYANVEHIVIDGGSTDGTVDVIRRYENRLSAWVSEPDKGIYDAMNKGIGRATGEWINFMNSGDRFESATALSFFYDAVPDVDVLYGDAIVEYPGFKTMMKRTPVTKMWKRLPFCHQATFVRGSLMKEFRFDTRYRMSSDFDLIYRLYLAGKVFKYVNRLICYFDFTTGASISNQFLSLSERKDSVLRHSYSVGKWIYYEAITAVLSVSAYTKMIFGKELTEWVTRLLRK